MAGRFVGRGAELAVLATMLDRAPPVVEVTGEPGIGKTRLLREFAALAAARGFRTWHGRATQYENSIPFDLLAQALGNADIAMFRDDHPQQAQTLASIIPGFGVVAPGFIPGPQLYTSVRALLEWAADDGLVLLLDDVHWADAETIAWLRYLLRRPLPDGVCVVVARRDSPQHVTLATALAQARADGIAAHVGLGPLTLQDAMRLVPDENAYRASGGNPLYLEVLSGQPDDQLRPAVLAELESLPSRTLLLARSAAVAGDPFDPGLAAAIGPLARPEVTQALDDLAEAGLVHFDREAGGFVFRHPLVREIIYDTAGVGWLTGAHARAVQHLRGLNLPASRVADHAERCAGPGDRELTAILVEAGREVLPHAPRTAARWLGAAVRLFEDASDVRLDLASALSMSGQFERGWEILAPLAGQRGNRKALLLASLLERHLGRTDNARRLLQRAVDVDADTALLLELCYHHLMCGDIASQAKCANQVLRLASDAHDHLREAAGHAQLALTEFAHGNLAAATDHRDHAARLLEVLPDEALRTDLDACCHLATAELQLELPGEARERIDRILFLSRSGGHGIMLIQAATLSALAFRQAGDITAAWRSADDALEMARSTGSDRWRMTLLVLSGELAVIRGDAKDGIDACTEAIALAATDADRWLTRHVPMILAVAEFATGHTSGHVDRVLAAYGGVDLPALDVASRIRVYETLTWMESLVAGATAASVWADRATRACDGVTLPTSRAFAHLARAQAVVFNDPRLARQHAGAAAEAFSAAGARYEAARARLTEAIAAGDPRLLAEAGVAMTSCGARLPPGLPLAADPVTTLSPRERQVAELVAAGRTNRRIARELGMSEKTVETHLSRIFAKLGAVNRAMVARAMGSQGFP